MLELYIDFKPFIMEQPYFVFKKEGDDPTKIICLERGKLSSISNYSGIMQIVDKYNIENIKMFGNKVVLNKYKDEFKKEQITKFGYKKIKVEIIE